jgi:hypothetical protein
MKQLVDDLNCEVTVGHFRTDDRNIGTNTNINSHVTIYPVGLLAIGLQSLNTKSDPKFALKSYPVPLSSLQSHSLSWTCRRHVADMSRVAT